MDITIHLNPVEEDMLKELRKADGYNLTDEEFAQKLFSSILWIEHDKLYNDKKENRNKIRGH